MANPVTVADIESRWRPLDQQETVVAGTLIDDAWTLLTESHVPSLDEYLTAGSVSAGSVKRVVSQMVLRVLKNPEGWRRESLDDWSGERFEAAAGELYPTDDELVYLQPYYTGLGQAFTVSLSG